IMSCMPAFWSVKSALPSSFIVRSVPFTETLGVGVRVCVAVGEGVAVNGFAASVCFASARAVLASEVSTAGGFTTGPGADVPQPLIMVRRKEPIRMKYKRAGFIVSSEKNPSRSLYAGRDMLFTFQID